MAYFLRAIDDFFFDSFPGFQEIQNWTQIHFGVNCFGLAKILNLLMVCNKTIQYRNEPLLLMMALLVPFVITSLFFNVVIQMAESVRRKRYKNILRNIDNFIYLRLFFLASSPCVETETLLTAVCMLYFIACTPLPPSDSTIKKWRNPLRGAKLQRA